ncbi:hypothetical protein [Streptomyces globisporus]|uniref:hypothetical protein n=1 Tax=Streptomyces globisporus TaxID=1908 RepID=UPI00029AE0D7|nr:hypothetical protein [Streptomyces globisporus]
MVECTRGVPIVLHRPSVIGPLALGGRRVAVHRHGRDAVLGIACSDRDLVER